MSTNPVARPTLAHLPSQESASPSRGTPAGRHVRLSVPAPAALVSVELYEVRCRCGVLLRLVRVLPDGEAVCRHGICGLPSCRARFHRGGLA